jgi:hypothetical protein
MSAFVQFFVQYESFVRRRKIRYLRIFLGRKSQISFNYFYNPLIYAILFIFILSHVLYYIWFFQHTLVFRSLKT